MAQTTNDFYDISADVKKTINKRYDEPGQKARKLHDAGKLKLVREQICEPYDGYGFELKKGQTVRYELISGTQIIDTVYMVKSRPTDEWASNYHTAVFGGMNLFEGVHYYSNPPFVRPLLTLIRDTVDYEGMRSAYGEATCHSFVFPNGRCNSGLYEMIWGIVDAFGCDMAIKKGIMEVAGEEVARTFKAPMPFMHFQVVDFVTQVPPNLTYFPSKDYLKPGDYVELLAHEDLYCAFSMCPLGDQNDMTSYDKFTCHPIRLAIYEGEDGPLETAVLPEQKSMEAIEFIKAGMPGMVTPKNYSGTGDK